MMDKLTRKPCPTCGGCGEIRRDLTWGEAVNIANNSNSHEELEDAIRAFEQRRGKDSEVILRMLAKRATAGYLNVYALAVAEEIRVELINFPEEE